ncbi:MAG: DUF1559 domain-containing protein [Gemmataceae bacterium]
MPRPAHTGRPRTGFTLVELAVVVAIVAVLVGLLLSAVQQVRSRAARAVCANRLRQLAFALHGYAGSHGALPPGVTVKADGGNFRNLSWHTRLLPHLEQEALWRRAEEAYRTKARAWDPPHPNDEVVPAFGCPADPGPAAARVWQQKWRCAYTSFLGSGGTDFSRQDGVLYVDSRTRFADLTDGTASTLLVGERPAFPAVALGWWYAGVGQVAGNGSGDQVLGALERCYYTLTPQCPAGPHEFGPGRLSDPCDAFHFWSLHPAGANFAFADGSVRFLPYSARSVLPDLATRAGGEAADVP